jgi:chromosome segregation ATPase
MRNHLKELRKIQKRIKSAENAIVYLKKKEEELKGEIEKALDTEPQEVKG